MPGYLSVRPQDWAMLTAVTGGPMVLGAEAHGIHIRAAGGGWSKPTSGIGDTAFVPRVCGTSGSATRIYAVYADTFGGTFKFATSNDAGATFTDMTIPEASPGLAADWTHPIFSPADGTVYMAVGGSGSNRGIWKTTNHGSSWSRVVTFPSGTIRCGSVYATATHLWYTRFIEGAGAAAACYYSALDGTGQTTIPTVQAGSSNSPPQMYAGSDSMAFIMSNLTTDAYTWTIGAGSASAVSIPSGGGLIGIAAITDQILLAIDYAPDPVSIQRSADGGSSWADVHDYTFGEADLSGGDDAFGRKVDYVKVDPTKAFAVGSHIRNSGSPDFIVNNQMYVLVSDDRGLTWAIDDVTTLPAIDTTFVWDIGALG